MSLPYPYPLLPSLPFPPLPSLPSLSSPPLPSPLILHPNISQLHRLVLYLSMFGFVFDPASQPVVKLARGSKKPHYVQLLRVPISVPSVGLAVLPSAREGTQPEPPLVWSSAVHRGHAEQLGSHQQWLSSADPTATARPFGNVHAKDTTKLVKRKGDPSQRSSEGKSRRSALVDELLSNGISHYEGKRESLVRLPATPEEIRTEVESMLEDVMSRVKQLLFNSVLCTYYTAFIPLQFVGVSGPRRQGLACALHECMRRASNNNMLP